MATHMFCLVDSSSSSSSSEDEEEFFIQVCAAYLRERRKRRREICPVAHEATKRQFLSARRDAAKRGSPKRQTPPVMMIKHWHVDFESPPSPSGAYSQLLQELLTDDATNGKKFLRITHETFQELLQLVRPDIKKEHTVMRKAIEPEERLALTLRFLGSGESFVNMSSLFHVANNTISQIVLETCAALFRKLKDKYLNVPATSKEWETIASQFESRWQLPNCIGVLNGKHIQIISPGKGSSAFKDKHYQSIILMVLVDASYKVMWFRAGCTGRDADAGGYRESSLAKGIEDNGFDLPEPKPLPGRDSPVPFFIVGDDAFGLEPHLMKPFPPQNADPSGWSKDPADTEKRKQHIFNYRLSRAQQLSQDAFVILAARFGVFQTPLRLSPERAAAITSACLALHNFLLTKQDQQFAPPPLVDSDNLLTKEQILGEMRNTSTCFQSLRQIGDGDASSACWVRDEIKEYVNAEGRIPWQEECALGRPLVQ